MKELVEMIASALVDNPDEVVVTETETEERDCIETERGSCRHGQSYWQAGKDCESDPNCSACFGFKERQKNTGRHSVMTSDMCLRKCHKVSQAYFLSKGTFGSE